MKKTITLLLMLMASIAVAQFNSDKIGITQRGDNYVIRDTIISGTDTIIQVRITSAAKFTEQYLQDVERNFEDVAMSRANAIEQYQRALKQRDELQKLSLLGTYLNYVDGQMTISGQFRASYGATSTTLEARADEHLYTLGGVKVINTVEVARNWVRCTMVTMSNEVIDVYEIRPGVWAGEGVNGLLIIQKL